MITTKCFATENMEVFDTVKFTESENGKTGCVKCTKGRPSGLSMYQVIDFNSRGQPLDWDKSTPGSQISVIQKGIIPHMEELNYKLGDKIYCNRGKLTAAKSSYKVGVVVPDGIYVNFLD